MFNITSFFFILNNILKFHLLDLFFSRKTVKVHLKTVGQKLKIKQTF